MDVEVIVVGAGPTGLMLAAELALAGTEVLVVEARGNDAGQSRAGGLTPRTVELLDQRGLLEPLVAAGAVIGEGRPGHFAGLLLDRAAAGTRRPWLHVPQHLLEQFLADVLVQRGVAVLRGRRLTAFTQDTAQVIATLDDGRRIGARYLVGADGARSSVRKLAGIDFPGTAATTSNLLADIRVDGPVAELLPSGPATVLSHTRRVGARWVTLLPYLDDTYRLMAGPGDPDRRDQPVTEAEIRTALHTGFGSDLRLREVRAASRFGDAYRQAQRYREGRVLLAGDAAHIHPPLGGQGLNLGVGDAVNLGWKLAGAVAGWAPASLLDSYPAERAPVAARVLATVRAQTALVGASEDVAALRAVLTELLAVPGAHALLAARMAGTDLRYPMPGTHPLIGTRLPDLTAMRAGREFRLFELLRSGRGQLIERDGDTFRAAASAWRRRVDYQSVTMSTAEGFGPGVRAVLVRPDGCPCWVGTSEHPKSDSPGLAHALSLWFGAGDRSRPVTEADLKSEVSGVKSTTAWA